MELDYGVESHMSILMDKQAAINQLESEGSMSSVKYIDVRMIFICNYTRRAV